MQIIPKLCQSWARCVNTEIFSKASAACTDGAVMWSVSLIEIRKPFLADFPELLSQDSQDCTPLSLKTQRRGNNVPAGFSSAKVRTADLSLMLYAPAMTPESQKHFQSFLLAVAQPLLLEVREIIRSGKLR